MDRVTTRAPLMRRTVSVSI